MSINGRVMRLDARVCVKDSVDILILLRGKFLWRGWI